MDLKEISSIYIEVNLDEVCSICIKVEECRNAVYIEHLFYTYLGDFSIYRGDRSEVFLLHIEGTYFISSYLHLQ